MTRSQYLKAAATLLFRAREDDKGRDICLDRAARYLRAAGLSADVLTVTGVCDSPTDAELEALETRLRDWAGGDAMERAA